jgi:large subunit ribosomal protein L25
LAKLGTEARNQGSSPQLVELPFYKHFFFRLVMSTETLAVELRTVGGSHESRKLRRVGNVPGILYGHGQEPVKLSVSADALNTALRHHSRLVQLQGGVNESALIKDIQFDTFGIDILHVDFTRVSTDERIEVEVTVELKGTSPGALSGGVINHLLHEVQIECLATAIPEKLTLNISNLQKGDELTASKIDLPADVKLLTNGSLIAVQCLQPGAEPDATAVGGPAEPEVIKRKVDAEATEEK